MTDKIYIILNIILVILEVIAAYKRKPDISWQALAFYTVLSNIMAMISSLVLLITGFNGVSVLLRYLACCMMAMTFFVTTCILVPLGGDPNMLLFSGSGLYQHLLCPVLCVCSYIFFEHHSRLWAVPVVLTFAYGMLMLYLNHKNVVDGPYPFFRVHQQTAGKTVLWMTALLCLIAAVSLLMLLAAK